MIDNNFMRGFVKLYALWRAAKGGVCGMETMHEMRELAYRNGLAALALLVALGSGCAHYRARPIEPAKSETEFRARTVTDAGLLAYLETNRVTRPTEWNLASLTLVALYFHPEMDVARAGVGVAEADVLTAGQRPNPALSWSPEYNANAAAGVSPWTLGFSLDIPIETAGKRGYRLKQARALTGAARIELAATAWNMRSRVRATLLDHLLAARQLDLLRAEEAARADAVTLMEQRLGVGEVSRPDVDSARIELANTRLAIRAAQGSVAETRAALASALGVPDGALTGVKLDWPRLDQPPGLPARQQAGLPDTLQEAGLLNRLDIRHALEEYAAAEATLQLEIAKQYPDVHLSPGYTWNQGDHKYALGLSVDLPVLNRNQGPIAVAEARRKEFAARFLALQAQVIGQTERALARYCGAMAECDEANELVSLLQNQQRAAEHAVEVGESDKLALAGIRVQTAVAFRARLDTLRKVQTAVGALEDAVQRPLTEER